MASALIGLAGVILGGVIGLIGPWLLEGRKQAEIRQRRRAEKFEELVAAFYEFDHWLEKFRIATAYGLEKQPETMPPFGKIEAIIVIHFPQFGKRLTALEQKVDELTVCIHKAAVARTKSNAAPLENSPEFSTELLAASKAYLAARLDFLSALREFGAAEYGRSSLAR
jgi:hypothetical protein